LKSVISASVSKKLKSATSSSLLHPKKPRTMHLRSVGAFTKAIDDNDSYALFTIAKDEHFRSSSFAVVLHIFQQVMTIKKDGSFSKLIQDLTDHRMILMNALPDSEFMFMKESMYAKDLKVAFLQFAVVLQEMQNFDPIKKKATPKQEVWLKPPTEMVKVYVPIGYL